MTSKRLVAGIIAHMVDVVLPPRCIITGDIVGQQGAISPEAWRTLDFIADPLCDCCGVPFEFKVENHLLCAHCLKDKPVFDQARAALIYNENSKGVILRFKHGDKTQAAKSFAPWMQRAGAGLLAHADLLVPVPLHRWRLLRRRYNQAALLAQALSKQTGILCVPDLLLRQKSTPPQGHLTAKQRRANVKNAFKYNDDYIDPITEKHIVLIDDVYTSGATITECCKVLKNAGAARVDVLTLARVVRAR